MGTKTRVTLEQFLALPETEPPSELVDGEVFQKVAPNIFHAILTAQLILRLGVYLQATGEGFVANELRHVSYDAERVYLPDISAFRSQDRGRALASGSARPVDLAPPFAIEVLSPGTSFGRTAERAAFFMGNGTELLWLVDPETESVTVYRPGAEPRLHHVPSRLAAAPVFPGFQLDLGDLFELLHEADAADD